MRREVNVLALIKGEERYLYLFDDDSHPTLLATLTEQAADTDLALNGFDAAILAQRSREQLAEEKESAAREG